MKLGKPTIKKTGVNREASLLPWYEPWPVPTPLPTMKALAAEELLQMFSAILGAGL